MKPVKGEFITVIVLKGPRRTLLTFLLPLVILPPMNRNIYLNVNPVSSYIMLWYHMLSRDVDINRRCPTEWFKRCEIFRYARISKFTPTGQTED